jgi:hypothetical protein
VRPGCGMSGLASDKSGDVSAHSAQASIEHAASAARARRPARLSRQRVLDSATVPFGRDLDHREPMPIADARQSGPRRRPQVIARRNRPRRRALPALRLYETASMQGNLKAPGTGRHAKPQGPIERADAPRWGTAHLLARAAVLGGGPTKPGR